MSFTTKIKFNKNAPIKILHVVGTMDRGGAETLIMNLYRNIDRTKVQFDFLCHNRVQSAYSEEINALGGKMYKIDSPRHVGVLVYVKQLFNFFKFHPEYSIVHAHLNDANGIILAIAKKTGVKVLYSHCHVAQQNDLSIKTKLIHKISKPILSKVVSRPFACSKLAAEYLYGTKLIKNCIILKNAINVRDFQYGLQCDYSELFTDNASGQLVFGHIGRFTRVKNHDFVIDIFNCVLKQHPYAKLVLVGSGECEQSIRNKVTALGIADKVYFLGERDDVNCILKQLNILLFPSFHEGLSLVCVEAQASGLPILTSTNVSSEVCLTDLVEQKSLDDSAKSWADAALRLICKHKNDDRSQYCIQVAKQGFDAKTVSKQIEDIYLKDAEVY